MTKWIEVTHKDSIYKALIPVDKILRINSFPQIILEGGKAYATVETYDELKQRIMEVEKC